MRLVTSIYSANRGYAWSNIPEGLSNERMMSFCRAISALRGDFADPVSVEVGLVSDGELAAAFTLQNVEHWDAAGRSSDYFAFAFFPVADARLIDFVSLINSDFFWTPTHEPVTTLTYEGPASNACPEDVVRDLQLKRRLILQDPRVAGGLLAAFRGRDAFLTCRLYGGNGLEVICNPLNAKKGRIL